VISNKGERRFQIIHVEYILLGWRGGEGGIGSIIKIAQK